MRCVNYTDCSMNTCRPPSKLFKVIAEKKKIRHVQSVHIVILIGFTIQKNIW